ncbi:MAG: hypothetical protein LC808_12580 [Actinobacteria bacterium]|nr:hypothetical protein [Actinomycetota bacterium]
MQYPAANKALGIHATSAEKMTAVCEALELSSLDECHPNAAETIRRRILTIDDDSLSSLLVVIMDAKIRYAAQQ